MPVSIIAGGQYGSEGKGKVVLWWGAKVGAKIGVRVGGSNSGHTIYDESGTKHIFRVLPVTCILDNTMSIISAGSYLDIDLFFSEIAREKLDKNRILIDPNAVIITDKCKEAEKNAHLFDKIGSTQSGTGEAVLQRVARRGDALLARDVDVLKPFLNDTKKYLRQALNKNVQIILEGTQGYGLSNIHSKDYPDATSRDTTASAILSETGLSPFDVEHIILVLRAYPIRVGGNSGNLEDEIDWEIVTKDSGSSSPILELTTVTNNIRRVARFTSTVVKDAICANKPDIIIMNHLDYVDCNGKNAEKLTDKQRAFVIDVEKQIGSKINFYGVGVKHIIDK